VSIWYDIKYRAKKAALVIWGPADLDESRDPQRNLEREHDEQKKADPKAKDWDSG
jgi:hypothetical protein